MMHDRKKVIKGLTECIADIDCDHCPYEDDCFDAIDDDRQYGEQMMRDALELLKELKAQEPVRCKDCKHYMTVHCTCDGCCISPDWFCADGERRAE